MALKHDRIRIEVFGPPTLPETARSDASRGEPIRGDREIDEAKADVVRRIFRELAAGVGPRTIARTLNKEGVPGPNGKLWKDTTIRGHVRRGTGLVNNELYIGRLIRNRLRYLKDPSTGRRVSRLNPESAWITTDVPELRIVDDKLWQAVRKRQGKIAEKFVNVTEAVREHHRTNRLNVARRPRSLVSGLIFCGCCGGPYLVDLDGELHDLRGQKTVRSLVYHDHNYAAGQHLARTLRKEGSNGIAYDSVRHDGGECAALFRPPLLSNCRQERHLCYIWDGQKIASVYEKRELSKEGPQS